MLPDHSLPLLLHASKQHCSLTPRPQQTLHRQPIPGLPDNHAELVRGGDGLTCQDSQSHKLRLRELADGHLVDLYNLSDPEVSQPSAAVDEEIVPAQDGDRVSVLELLAWRGPLWPRGPPTQRC